MKTGPRQTVRLATLAVLASAGMEVAAPGETGPVLSLRIPPEAIIAQRLYADHSSACGPAALANCLRFGTEPMRSTWESFVGVDDSTRLRFLIDRWFRSEPSSVIPDRKRFSLDGVLEEDLADACRDVFASHQLPAPSSGYLDRRPGEKSPALVARVHESIADSLEAGMPPILSLKTYIARRLRRMDDQLAWELAAHHWVVVTGIRRELRPTDLGFSIDLIDPERGYETSAYVHTENRQDFHALKGTEALGQWLTGRPFLLVEAPAVLTLRPREAEWPDRVIVVANYLIGEY